MGQENGRCLGDTALQSPTSPSNPSNPSDPSNPSPKKSMKISVPLSRHVSMSSDNNPGQLSPRNRPAPSNYRRPSVLGKQWEDPLWKIGRMILKWNSSDANVSYAETINTGKTPLNEDQGSYTSWQHSEGTAHFFGVYDGHGGWGCSLVAASVLPSIVKKELEKVQAGSEWANAVEDALSRSFEQADSQIEQVLTTMFGGEDKECGGASALGCLVLNGHLFVANAGDCRAIIVGASNTNQTSHEAEKKDHDEQTGDNENQSKQLPWFISMSRDFGAEQDRARVQRLVLDHPELMGNVFTRKVFLRPLKPQDLGAVLPCLDYDSDIPVNTKVTEEDVSRVPLVVGTLEAQRAPDQKKDVRLLGTVATARGFGDYKLRSTYGGVPVKPFLTPIPEVRHLKLSDAFSSCEEQGRTLQRVLVVASDGYWDQFSRSHTAVLVAEYLNTHSNNVTGLAEFLIGLARGSKIDGSGWRVPPAHSERLGKEPLPSPHHSTHPPPQSWQDPIDASMPDLLGHDKPGSGDDITVWVVDLSKLQGL